MDLLSRVDAIVSFGLKVFFVVWAIYVPVIITARLEKIIKLLEGKDRK
jgi:hypothetical protein